MLLRAGLYVELVKAGLNGVDEVHGVTGEARESLAGRASAKIIDRQP